MSTAARKTHLTPEQYLAIERQAETKSEYYRGEMFAMSGASRHHNQIAFNLCFNLRLALGDRRCAIYISDVRVLVRPSGLYTYPDVVATCDKPEFLDGVSDTLLNPRMIVEVLSPSTAVYDRGKKFIHYREIESLHDYVIVEQERMLVEHHSRGEGTWTRTELRAPSNQLQLESFGVSIPLSALYEMVDLPPPEPPAGPATG